MQPARSRAPSPGKGRAGEVFAVFLRLGLTSFGGPIAHLGYFRDELVSRRRWLDDDSYADLVALCQFLPGPASSQVGFAIGLMRAGWPGAAAAFVGFTLPSALILTALAMGMGGLPPDLTMGLVHGLKIVAVAIVAQAVLGMARSLAPDAPRATIACAAVVILAGIGGPSAMLLAMLAGALAGLFILPSPPPGSGAVQPATTAVSRRQAFLALALLVAALVLAPVLAPTGPGWAIFDSFTRAGTLVFGGGHVVLPLLQAEMVSGGLVAEDAFLAGYGAAQAVPGPLFTFAAWLGALATPGPQGTIGAMVALIAIFLPGFLILVAALPFWQTLRQIPQARGLLAGANAAVVGILGAALYSPVFTSAIGGMADFALALCCFIALTAWKLPPWTVVCLGAAGGHLLTAVS